MGVRALRRPRGERGGWQNLGAQGQAPRLRVEPPNTASKDQPYRVKASNTDFLLLLIAAGCL